MPNDERGFSLILAIFLMVVFALLLAALVQIETASNHISGAQATAERALMAAQSGAEAGVYQITPATGSPAAACFSPISSSSLAGLANCSVSATCSSATDASGNTDFLVTSTGTCGAATRTVVVSLTESGNQSCTHHECMSECKSQLGFFGFLCRIFFCSTKPYPKQYCPTSQTASVSMNYWLEKLQ